MSMSIATIVFSILSAMFFVGVMAMLLLPNKILQSKNVLKLIQPEAFAGICFSLFVGFALVALQCHMM